MDFSTNSMQRANNLSNSSLNRNHALEIGPNLRSFIFPWEISHEETFIGTTKYFVKNATHCWMLRWRKGHVVTAVSIKCYRYIARNISNVCFLQSGYLFSHPTEQVFSSHLLINCISHSIFIYLFIWQDVKAQLTKNVKSAFEKRYCDMSWPEPLVQV